MHDHIEVLGAADATCRGCHEAPAAGSSGLCSDCEITTATLAVAKFALSRPWARRLRGCS